MSCAKTELCIFDSAAPQVVIDSAVFEEIFPINTVTDGSDVEFSITGSDTEYLDLNDTLLYVQVKVVGLKDADLAAAVDVTPCNFFFYSLFDDVTLSLNNQKVEGGNRDYPEKAMLETILNYSSDTKNTCLASIGYDPKADNRKAWIAKSVPFSMCGPLQLDFFDQPKYLMPNVNLHLRLKPNNVEYCIKGADVRLKILATKLFVRRVKVDPSVLVGHRIGLTKQNAIYPIRKTRMVSYSLPIGTTNYNKDQIFGDVRLPKFVLICFKKTDNVNGIATDQSSTYEHLSVGSLTLSRNNDFRETYTQDFKVYYVTSYVTSIIRNMGYLDKDLNIGISLADFKSTYPFFTFILAPDFDIHQTQLPKQGNLRLEIKFDTALTSASSIIIYGVFDDEIQINNNGTIII